MLVKRFLWLLTSSLVSLLEERVPFLFDLFLDFISVASLAIVRGPCASGYKLSSSLTSRLNLASLIHPCAHLDPGLLASHILIWQWTNTNGWSAMNLNASVLKRFTPTVCDCMVMVVSSTGQLKDVTASNYYQHLVCYNMVPCKKKKMEPEIMITMTLSRAWNGKQEKSKQEISHLKANLYFTSQNLL